MAPAIDNSATVQLKLLQKMASNRPIEASTFVIQKYLERPLLIKKRKFDMRLYVLVTHDQKCYLFKEGYIRMSSREYSLSAKDKDNPFVHLTNNAIQKLDKDSYGAFEEGNMMGFQQAAASILEDEGRFVNFYDICKEKILPSICTSLQSVRGTLNPAGKKFCFELFGYDYMIDRDLKPWLIEVNTNPSLTESSALLSMILPRMLDDAFKLTVDSVFPPM